MTKYLRAVTLVLTTCLLLNTHVNAQQTAGTTSTTPRPATARPTPAPPSDSNLPSIRQMLADITRAEVEANSDLLVFSYGHAIREPLLARTALGKLMYDYYNLRIRAASAAQASQAVDEATLRFSLLQAAQNQVIVQQNQRLIEQNDQLVKQNQRIVELLERIANK